MDRRAFMISAASVAVVTAFPPAAPGPEVAFIGWDRPMPSALDYWRLMEMHQAEILRITGIPLELLDGRK
jgi:hypothetical protein